MTYSKGSKCVCIDDKFPVWVYGLYTQLPKKGEIYVIRSSGMGNAMPEFGKNEEGKICTTSFEEDFAILLEELHNPPDPFNKTGDELGFRSVRFAPLQTVDTEASTEEDEEWSLEKEQRKYEKIHKEEFVEI
jgi:hypothetical protein